ncbi:MAG: carbamoyltransferase C-terminal domain-containing protein [Acidimicrobiales bacterium]
MDVLGIHDGHNASAALVRDGELIAACEEERFTANKNQAGYPANAVQSVLNLGGVAPERLDLIAVAGRYAAAGFVAASAFSRHATRRHHQDTLAGRDRRYRLKTQLSRVPALRHRRRAHQLRRRQGAFEGVFPDSRVVLIDHHECHAAGAYYGWGQLDVPVLVLTADGDGDDLCGTVSLGNGGQLERIAAIPKDSSLGWPYEAVTFLLGMQPFEHEYKVMGLAPYAVGAPAVKPLVERLLALYALDGTGPRGNTASDRLGWRRAHGVPPLNHPTRTIWEIVRHQRFDHVAGAIQEATEIALVSWVRRCIAETGVEQVALSGGVFMNVKANGRILALDEVHGLFVMPNCGDGSNAIGAAFAATASGGCPPRPIGPLYLGEEITDDQVRAALAKRAGGPIIFEVRWPDDPEGAVAELLAQGEIVARATGRMEFGARALGNRSVLADPSRPDCVRTINELIKARDFWMPFAPAVPAEDADRYVQKPARPQGFTSPYMMVAFPSRSDTAAAFPAAMHPADRTARLQEVPEAWNPSFHRLLRHFERLRGNSILLNTSLNIHGSPIARSADDALDVLQHSGLQHLQLGNALISMSPCASW